MQKRIPLVLILSLLLLGLAVHGETAVPKTPGAHVGGTLTIGVSQTFKDLDPRVAISGFDLYVVDSVFDQLVILHPDTAAPMPALAKGWDVIDDARVRFYLNEGVTAHNGEAITAEDVVFTLSWIANEENASPKLNELTWLEEIVAVDEYTVDVVTKADYAPYAPGFINLQQAIVPKDTVLEMGDEAFNLAPVGSGPYAFVEWRTGESIRLKRNEDYWLVYPNLDEVVFRPIPELSVMMLELEAGGIDIADNMPATDVQRFRDLDNIDVQQVASLSYFHMYFNLQSPISSDLRFRKAVYMSVDWDAAVFSIFQDTTGLKAYGCIPPTLWGNDREFLRENVALPEDDDQAVALFAELKSEGVMSADTVIRVHTPLDPRRRQLATILATSLIENGVEAEMVPLDWGPLLDLAYRSDADPVGDFEMMWMGWGGPPDPHNYVYYLFHSDGTTIGAATNTSWTQLPELDRLVDEAARTLDQAEREAKYVEAQRLALSNYSSIPGYHYIETRGVNTRVHGFLVSPMAKHWLCTPYQNVWVDG